MTRRSTLKQTRGIAQLEFVLVLVVLLPLFLALLWSGMFGSALARVAVNTRHKVWRQRHETLSKAFEFDAPSTGKITQQDSLAIKLSPLFDTWAKPESTSSAFGGAWDHRVIKLNERSPNRPLALLIANQLPLAVGGDFESAWLGLRKMNDLESLMDRVLGSSGMQSLMANFAKLGIAGRNQVEAANRKADTERENMKAQMDKIISQKKEELDKATSRSKMLEGIILMQQKQLGLAQTDEEKMELRTAIEVSQKEQKRISDSIPQLQKELDFLNDSPLTAPPS